jgi:hypothetical protein
MIGDTLTTENLLAIFEAMSKIKPIDRSQCFDRGSAKSGIDSGFPG